MQFIKQIRDKFDAFENRLDIIDPDAVAEVVRAVKAKRQHPVEKTTTVTDISAQTTSTTTVEQIAARPTRLNGTT